MSRYRKRAASHVAQGGRAIGAFLYIGRIGAANETRTHLRSRGVKRTGNYLSARVVGVTQCVGPSLTSSRLPPASAMPLNPGGSSVVVSICSMMAGPEMRLPVASEARL